MSLFFQHMVHTNIHYEKKTVQKAQRHHNRLELHCPRTRRLLDIHLLAMFRCMEDMRNKTRTSISLWYVKNGLVMNRNGSFPNPSMGICNSIVFTRTECIDC